MGKAIIYYRCKTKMIGCSVKGLNLRLFIIKLKARAKWRMLVLDILTIRKVLNGQAASRIAPMKWLVNLGLERI